jgi:Domain of unknown function (DUF4159)/Aerotolerance regulator N-terminal
MNAFAGLSFGVPWILAALAVLPAIWWLLRVTPPAPRRVVFPPFRLLLGLDAPQETPARTPLLLLMLRLLAAAILIVAFAEPTIGRLGKIAGSGPIVLFVDNDWAAAQNWNNRDAAISEALAEAASAGRPVAIVRTASATPPLVTLLDSGEAEREARAIEPVSWQPDRVRAANAVAKASFPSRPDILWLSDSLDFGDAAKTAGILSSTGNLRIYADGAKQPVVLVDEHNDANGFIADAVRSDGDGARDATVEALGAHGEELASSRLHFASGDTRASAKLALPLEVRNETRRLAIAGVESAGATRLLGSGARRLSVGLVSANNLENLQPLLSSLFYLKRALTPFADVHEGDISTELARNVSVLILADVGNISGVDHDRVAAFVANGGVLLRFAGGRMTANVDDLIPVKLRVGGRYLGGALAWASPQHLAPFPDASPFRGLAIPSEVTVSRQVLAEPSVELGERTWARLADGTPLVTAAPRDKGWIVLFHVTASPAWSSLPLSGLYVDMLRRVLDLANGARPSDLGTDASAVFPAIATLDGFGHARKPPPEALPIHGSDIGKIVSSAQHPAGLYGSEGAEIPVNVTDAKTLLVPIGESGVSTGFYSGVGALALKPPLLMFALALLLADTLISLWLRGYLAGLRRFAIARPALVALCVLVLAPREGRADDAFDTRAALDTRLAYVVTGISDVDEMSKAGLYGLGLRLKARTSYEPQEPMGVDINRDDLSFFPLLYWPMDPREGNLSPQAVSKLTEYMKDGGTILFDTRDLTLGPVRGADSPGEQTLRRLTAKLDLPPLQPIPSAHVLTKAFYLLQDFPGRWDGGRVWVEALPPPDPDAGPEPARGGDGVSPVIIGGNDWAAAWAVDSSGRPLVDVSPGGEEQRELAVRFGINVVMYALTGNYKSDQVHVPALLERLGH